jgi:hypothetical protein
MAPLAVACDFVVPLGLNAVRFLEWGTQTLMETLEGRGQIADKIVDLVDEGLKAGTEQIKNMLRSKSSSFLEVDEDPGSEEGETGFDLTTFVSGSDKPWAKPFAEIAQAYAKYQTLSWKTVLEDVPPKVLNRGMHFVQSCDENGQACTSEIDSENPLSLPADTGSSTCTEVQYTCTPNGDAAAAPTPAECKQLREGEELESHKIADYTVTSQCVIDPEMTTPEDDLAAMGGSTCTVVEISSDTLMLGVINQVQKLSQLLKSASSSSKEETPSEAATSTMLLELPTARRGATKLAIPDSGDNVAVATSFLELKAEQAAAAASATKFLCKARNSIRTKLGVPTIIRATLCNVQRNKPWVLEDWDSDAPPTNATTGAPQEFRAQLEVLDQGQLVYSSVYDGGFVVDLAKRQGAGLFERVAKLPAMPKIISEALSNSWRVSLTQQDGGLGWKLSVEMPHVIAAIKSVSGRILEKLESLFGAQLKFGLAVAPTGESELLGISLRHLYKRLGIADKVGMVITKVGTKVGEVASDAAAGPLKSVAEFLEKAVQLAKDAIVRGKAMVAKVQKRGEEIVDNMLKGLKNAVVTPIMDLLSKFEAFAKDKTQMLTESPLGGINLRDPTIGGINLREKAALAGNLANEADKLTDGALSSEFNKASDKVSQAAYNATRGVRSTVSNARSAVSNASNTVSNAASLTTAKFVKVVTSLIEKIESGAGAMVKGLVDAIDRVGNEAATAVGSLGNQISKLQDLLDQLPEDAKKLAPFKLPDMEATVTKVTDLRDSVKGFVGATKSQWQEAADKFREAADESKRNFKGALADMKDTSSLNSLEDGADKILVAIAEVKAKVMGAYTETEAAANKFKSAVGTKREELEGRLDAAIAPAQPLLAGMNNFVKAMTDKGALGKMIAAKMKSAIYGAVTKQMRKLWFMKDSLAEVWQGFSPTNAQAVCPAVAAPAPTMTTTTEN